MLKFIIISLILHLIFLFAVKFPKDRNDFIPNELVQAQKEQLSENKTSQWTDSLTQDDMGFAEEDRILKDLEDEKLLNQAEKKNAKSTIKRQESLEGKKQDNDFTDSERALTNYLNILEKRR